MAANAADKLPPEQPVEEEAGDAPPATTRKRPATGEPDAASSKRARQSPTPRNGANSEGDEGADDEEKPEVSDGSAEPNEESEGEKSSNVRPTFRVALLDIEGTVCPISFVKDVLFPYALSALPTTLANEWSSPSFARYRDAFPPEHAATPEALTAHVQDLVRRDVKIAYLKSLQGYLWEEGYASGALKAPLFPDVAPKMLSWTSSPSEKKKKDGADADAAGGAADDGKEKEKEEEEQKIRVMIYSSGSVAAQKLLFQHTDYSSRSDLTGVISDYFDTVNAGLKTEAASYAKIAAKYPDVPVGEWLFLSDNVKEVEAAKAAGMQSFIVDRPGNAALSEEDRKRHRVVSSFDEI